MQYASGNHKQFSYFLFPLAAWSSSHPDTAIFCQYENMSNHCLHLDCGQKVFCGSPQQQMSSL